MQCNDSMLFGLAKTVFQPLEKVQNNFGTADVLPPHSVLRSALRVPS
jgi:hypothetical protein